MLLLLLVYEGLLLQYQIMQLPHVVWGGNGASKQRVEVDSIEKLVSL